MKIKWSFSEIGAGLRARDGHSTGIKGVGCSALSSSKSGPVIRLLSRLSSALVEEGHKKAVFWGLGASVSFVAPPLFTEALAGHPSGRPVMDVGFRSEDAEEM